MRNKKLPYIEPSIRTIAGVLLTLAGLAVLFFPKHLYLALGVLFFVSLNLAQSGFTRFCLMEQILKRFGFRSELDEIQMLMAEQEQMRIEERLMQDIDRQVLHNADIGELLGFVCAEVAEKYGYPFAWIGRKQEDGKLVMMAASDRGKGYLEALSREEQCWSTQQSVASLAARCISSGEVASENNIAASTLPSRECDLRFGFRSAVAIPLIVKEAQFGAFILYSDSVAAFRREALQRMVGIAGRISLALEMSLAQQQLKLQGAALAAAGNGVFITDRSGIIQWVNESFTRLTGYTAEEAIGNKPSLLKSGAQDPAYYQRLWSSLLKGQQWENEVVERHKSGRLFTVQQTITPILDNAGEVTHFVSILDDITAQKEATARIQYMAHYDALTSLPNRVLFYDRLQQALALSRRGGGPGALMFLDLDRFKAVNDTLGHHVGDLLLQAVAERLKMCVRETDTVSRLAGDEFTVLLPNVTQPSDAEIVATKIVAALAQPFLLHGNEVRIGCSIGIALYPVDADTEEALVSCADGAMYAAKEEGRGTFHFYRSLHGQSLVSH